MILILILLIFNTDTLNISLEQALDIARRSPDYNISQLDRREGDIRLGQGISSLLPTPSLSGTYSEKTWTLSLRIDQPLLNLPLYGGFLQSLYDRRFYKALSKEEENLLLFGVKEGYYNLIKSYGLIDVAKSALSQAEKNRDFIKKRYAVGEATKIDLLRSEVYLNQARMDLLSAEKSLKVANQALKGILGIERDVVIRPTLRLEEPAELEVELDSLFTLAERQNPRLISNRNSEKSASWGLFNTYTRLLPTLSGFWSKNYMGAEFPKGLDGWTSSQGIGLNLPLLNLPSILLDIAESKTRLERVRAEEKKEEFSLRKELLDGFLSYEKAQEKYRLAKKNLELSKELYKLSFQKFSLGELTSLELLDTEAKLYKARQNLLSALADTYIEKARIEYLIGR